MRTSPLLWSVCLLLSAGAVRAQSHDLFTFRAPLGARPTSLVRASDGIFYGTAAEGGEHGQGAIFMLSRSGSPKVVYAFTGQADGAHPQALVRDRDANLYGLSAFDAQADRSSGLGLFKLSAGGTPKILQTFPGADNTARLALAPDGVYGSTGRIGTIFHAAASGELQTLYTFANGAWASALIVGQDGNLYGTTTSSSSADPSTLFRLTPAGAYTALASFGANVAPSALVRRTDGTLFIAARVDAAGAIFRYRTRDQLKQLAHVAAPVGSLTEGVGSELYAASATAGTARAGSLLRVGSDGSVRSLYTFKAGSDGAAPSDIVAGSDGLFGITQEAGAGYGTVFRLRAYAGLRTLFSFNYPNGTSPSALVLGADGNLYGAAQSGGEHGAGTLFKATTAGEVTVVHAFARSDGAGPVSLTPGRDGQIYGRTLEGGSADQGTVFSFTPGGQLTTLHAFDQQAQGLGPALVQADDGALYGADRADSGHIFRIQPSGEYTVVYTFPGLETRDGASPSALIRGPNGTLLGATLGAFGPMIPPNFSSGTIFRIAADGTFSTVYAFNDGKNSLGASPRSLVLGADGTLYGATTNLTFLCGVFGKLFKLAPGATTPELAYSFSGQDDGTGPLALVTTGDAKLFGVTVGGMGLSGETCSQRNSTLFAFAPDTGLRTLETFRFALSQSAQSIELEHAAQLVAVDGKLFGVTAGGGDAQAGQLFELDLAK
jgi:uncharacterized repeat protein (TIGR03803 family)